MHYPPTQISPPLQTIEGGSHLTSGLPPPRFLQLTQHLSPQHCAFLAKWYPLIAFEEEAGKAARPQLWAATGAQREAAGGSCLAGLKLRAYKGVRELAEGERHCYEFERHGGMATSVGGVSSSSDSDKDGTADALLPAVEGSVGRESPMLSGGLLSGAFGPGDMALLGVDGRHPALARVTVSEVTQVRGGRQ